ncbi:MAG: hypothetical protein WCX08_03065 [Candidatus Buchananbacteria bacterium]|jgi:hypothetical protein
MKRIHEYYAMMSLLTIILAASTACDAWDIWRHGVDINKWLPGLFPVAMIAIMFTVRAVYRRSGTPETRG